jgi:hypothetical protein
MELDQMVGILMSTNLLWGAKKRHRRNGHNFKDQ